VLLAPLNRLLEAKMPLPPAVEVELGVNLKELLPKREAPPVALLAAPKSEETPPVAPVETLVKRLGAGLGTD
jgi:hypothetical protein